jgi:DNA polymerase I
VARLLLEWSGLEKLRGTFIEGLSGFLQPHPDGTQRVHTGFKQHGTKTGRLSAAEPNPQQLPREVPGKASIRSLYVAGPGYQLIVADYDQIELRCAAYESRDPEMLAVFRRGEDIHRSAAAAMFQVELEDVTEEMRSVGKTQNFAVLYGAGPAKIAFVAGCSLQRAKKLIRRYYRTFEALEPWKAKLLKQAREAGDFNDGARPPHVVIPPVGRLRRLPDLYENSFGLRSHAERQAVNARIQGFASNIAKMAMIDLHPRLSEFNARMLMQVHDEVVIRVDEERVVEALPLVVKTMSGVTNGDDKPILGAVPLIVSAKVGYTWASAKGAK